MKINSTGKMADKVGDVFENASSKATATSVKTGIAGILDSFVHSPAEKSSAAAGVVSGLKVQGDPSAPAVKVDPGLAADTKGRLLHGSRYYYGKLIDAKDLSKDQAYQKGARNPALVNAGFISSVAGTYLGATRANAALNRLSNLTGKSIEEISALLNQYGLDPGNPPKPADDKVNAFIHDPAFASIPPQALLQALYGQ